MSELGYWVAMSRIRGVGMTKLRALNAYFGSLARVWEASQVDLMRSGVDEQTALQICDARHDLSPDEEELTLEKHGVRGVISDDPDYPRLLTQITDPPPVLYMRGALPAVDELSLAMVGTRRPTAYGRHATSELVDGLVTAGAVTVSGLARGIDTCVHRETLDRGGRTVAVLAGGLDTVYPSENLALARRILESGGAVVSEHPPRTKLRREHFLRRNRIMSGISGGTVIVEAGERSGALATARNALDQNREVFAVPGGAFSPQSAGTNRLIQKGEAKLVLSAADILIEFGLSGGDSDCRAPMQADAVQSLLLSCMGSVPVHADELARELSIPSREVTASLSLLELQGVVRNMGNMHYVVTGKWLPEVS